MSTKDTKDEFSHGYFQGKVHSDFEAFGKRQEAMEKNILDIRNALKEQVKIDASRDRAFQEHLQSDAAEFSQINGKLGSKPSYKALFAMLFVPIVGWIISAIFFYMQLNATIADAVDRSVTPIIERIETIEEQLGELELID